MCLSKRRFQSSQNAYLEKAGEKKEGSKRQGDRSSFRDGDEGAVLFANKGHLDLVQEWKCLK